MKMSGKVCMNNQGGSDGTIEPKSEGKDRVSTDREAQQTGKTLWKIERTKGWSANVNTGRRTQARWQE